MSLSNWISQHSHSIVFVACIPAFTSIPNIKHCGEQALKNHRFTFMTEREAALLFLKIHIVCKAIHGNGLKIYEWAFQALDFLSTKSLIISCYAKLYVKLDGDSQCFVYVHLRGQVYRFPLLSDIYRLQPLSDLESYFTQT